jgi:hypothetical protein
LAIIVAVLLTTVVHVAAKQLTGGYQDGRRKRNNHADNKSKT